MKKAYTQKTREERKADKAEKLAKLQAILDGVEKSPSLTGITRMAAERFGNFSLKNQLLIISQRPDATHVAGFNAWKALGRHVSKGAKGIQILVPFTPSDKTREAAESDSKKARTYFGVGYVFDVSDTQPIEAASESEAA